MNFFQKKFWRSLSIPDLKLVFVVLVWGLNYKILPIGVREFGAPAFTLLRFAMTLPLLFLAVKMAGAARMEREDWPRLIAVGVIGTTLYQLIFAFGVAATTSTNAAILIALSPLFSFLLATVVRGIRHSLTNWFGLVMALVGAVLVISRGNLFAWSMEHLVGDAIMLVASILWALYSFLAEPLTKRYGGLAVTCWSLVPGVLGLLFLSVGDLFSTPWAAISTSAWWSLCFAVTLVTSVGLVFFYQAVPHLGSQRVMVYMFLVPVVAMFFSALVFGDSLEPIQWSAIVIVIVGVYLARMQPVPVHAPNLAVDR